MFTEHRVVVFTEVSIVHRELSLGQTSLNVARRLYFSTAKTKHNVASNQ